MSGKIAPDARSHRVSRTKTGSFSIELHPVGSGMVRASSLVGEFQQPANERVESGWHRQMFWMKLPYEQKLEVPLALQICGRLPPNCGQIELSSQRQQRPIM
jgi:hypothetical protein